MLRYIDFVPRQIAEPGLFTPGQHEDFDAAVMAANQWLLDHKVHLISLETVVLPNIWSRWEDGSRDASLQISGENPSRWHQFVRLWYHEPVDAPAPGQTPAPAKPDDLKTGANR